MNLEWLNDLKQLSSSHANALRWFAMNAGAEVPWPISLPDGTLLSSKAPGIYKPAGSKYALSVKQTLSSSYADREPIYKRDGSWFYYYYQQEDKRGIKPPELLSGNKALTACWLDGVPVGVLRQTKGKPGVRYKVLGLAFVVGTEAEYFLLKGVPSNAQPGESLAYISPPTLFGEGSVGVTEELSLETDLRARRQSSIIYREGQQEFRRVLLQAFNGRCLVSGCNVPTVLEAAHIVPYRGKHTNSLVNGLLLRADFHILFDEGQLAIEPSSFSVLLSCELERDAYYAQFANKKLNPVSEEVPSRELLKVHRHFCGL